MELTEIPATEPIVRVAENAAGGGPILVVRHLPPA
jgi:hypothetical protein